MAEYFAEMTSEVWGNEPPPGPQNLRVLMAGLRRKIENDPARPRYLLTEQGVGYRLIPPGAMDEARTHASVD